MLEVCVVPGLHKNESGLTWLESRSHFGAWAVTSNPLILGLDVRNDTTMDLMWPIIANAEVLAVNSAWAGASGTRVLAAEANVTWTPCGFWPTCSARAWEVWSKPLPGGGAAVVVLNHQPSANATVTVPWGALPGLAAACTSGGAFCAVRDLWAHANVGSFQEGFTISELAPHDSAFFTVQHA